MPCLLPSTSMDSPRFGPLSWSSHRLTAMNSELSPRSTVIVVSLPTKTISCVDMTTGAPVPLASYTDQRRRRCDLWKDARQSGRCPTVWRRLLVGIGLLPEILAAQVQGRPRYHGAVAVHLHLAGQPHFLFMADGRQHGAE